MSRSALRLTVAAAIACVVSLVPAAEAFANDAPVCVSSSRVAVDRVVQFDGSTCSDPNGDDIDYSVVDWPTGGSLVGDPETGVATYTAFFGTTEDSFTFRVFDGQVFSNTATVTITVPEPPAGNQAPECPDSNLFVEAQVPALVNGNCVDPDGDPLTYGINAFPTGGSLTFPSASSAVYTSNAGTLSDSFGYTATDGLHVPASATVSITVTSGNVFETAAEATVGEPFVASIDSPNGGPVLVDARSVTEPPPTGFLLLGQEFDIEAPLASAADPLKLTFKIDGSAAPAGQIEVFRDMATSPDPIPDCDPGAGGTADPDPCVLSRVGVPPSDVEVTVLTSHASSWNFAVGAPYDFSGFFSPVNALGVLNEVAAGRAVPVKFSLNGDQGLDVLAAGYPRSEAIACDGDVQVDGIESTVTPGSSALSYDAGADRYTYVWKTDKAWTGCRQLVVKLTDGSKHRANFKFR